MNYCNKSKFNSQTQDRLIVFKKGQDEGDPRQWGVWHRDCQTWSRNLGRGKPFTTPKTTCLVLLYPRQGLGPRQGGGPRRSKSKREKEQSTFERVPRHIVSTNILSPPSPLKPHRPKAPGQSQIWWGSGPTTTWGEKNLFFGVFISGVQMWRSQSECSLLDDREPLSFELLFK